ncbi:adenosylcobinamide-GDP ribazoletransferase [Comamonas aquatica]|uniref:adenosylcobinamide-GDP ribazoletransferase n=1 Tax=Comamonas aquatica TaxID=225991 RepID=UPI0005ED13E8|nr:adenosylcobinamide-GDP ribazoletransferase [Comamonas aquatica]ANY61415.1 adenosylcobinamide-GDP ribazoletransferase [Comamonas aquatica]MDH0370326.1 adenosylcobinamide-GDP ribazoletransferase [Comamonas aquatica]
MQPLRHFLLALQFFSRIPVTGRLAAWVGWSPALQRASAGHLPGVGWLVGLVAAAVVLACHYALATHPMLPWVAAVLSTAATLCVTGGFHEDGLADVADGLGGHLPAERALEVMKDSRLGAYGAMALCLGLLAKVVFVALLVQIDVAAAALLLCGVHVLSRAAPLVLMRTLAHVSKPAASKTLHIAGSPLGWGGVLTGLLWCLPALAAVYVYLGHATVLALLLTGAVVTAYLGWRFQRRLGGMTGDCLGATQQLCELAMYLVAGLLLAQYVL